MLWNHQRVWEAAYTQPMTGGCSTHLGFQAHTKQTASTSA